MNFLIGEIALWLLGAAIVGAVLGAVISRPRRLALQSARAEGGEQQRLAHTMQQRSEANQRRIAELEEALAEARVDRSRLANVEAQLRAAQTVAKVATPNAGRSSSLPPPPPPHGASALTGSAPPLPVR